jgi:lipopolysaccharide/colanic/teichoic acid biosynthesis glycosyltransferase
MSPWCNCTKKRSFDLIFAVSLLIPSLPLMIVIAMVVRITSPGPILFRQERPGKDGRLFKILKFRTMHYGRNEPGPILTRSGDPRLTWIGGILRKHKLDELPQLFNVFAGQMSFVGPRPQHAKLWAHFSEVPLVLKVRPGITGAATLAFRNEEEILKPLSSDKVEELYLKYLMPLKMQIDLDYLRNATLLEDIRLIFQTAFGVFKKETEMPDKWRDRLPAFMTSDSEATMRAMAIYVAHSSGGLKLVTRPSTEETVAVPENGD